MSTLSITDVRKERLTSYLRDQFSLALRGASSRQERLRTFIARYEAKTVQKNFPFRGASSIHVPLVAQHTDSIHARILNALKAQPDAFLDVSPLSEEQIGTMVDPVTNKPATWRLVAELLEEYMLFEISPAGEVNLIDAVDQFVEDGLMLGTGWMFGIWDTVTEYDFPVGGGRPVPHVSFDNMRFLNPAVEDIYFPANYSSLERIPWLSRKYLARPSEILNRVGDSGFNKQAVREYLSKHRSEQARVSEVAIERSYLAGSIDPGYYTTGELELAETWMRFVLDEPLEAQEDGSQQPSDYTYGKEVRIVVDHSFREPYTIFRIMPWPYEHGKIPAVVARYVRRRGLMEGMGIPERLESLDEGLSTNVNQCIDNVSVAGNRLWRVQPDSDAAEALEDMWPGKAIPAEQGDIEPLQAGEVYPSAFEIHNILQNHAERLSKVVEFPMQDVATARNSTATTTLAMQQEKGQYHDDITRNFRTGIDIMLQQWRDLIAQQKPLTRIRMVLGPRAQVLIDALGLSPADLAKRIGVRVSFSNTAATRELARQEEMAKLQILKGYYDSLIALAAQRFGNMQAGIPPSDPATALLIDQIAKASELHISKLLEQYGERSSTSNEPDWEEVKQVYEAEQQRLAQEQQLAALTGGGAQEGNGAQPPSGGPPGSALSPGQPQGAPGMAGVQSASGGQG